MADIKQLLQQMMASPERTLARAEQQQLSSLMRIFSGSASSGNSTAITTQAPQQGNIPTPSINTGSLNQANTTRLLAQLLVQISLPVTFEPAKGQQPPLIQGNNWQWPNPPKNIQPPLTAATKLQLTITQPDPKYPIVRVALSTGATNSTGATKPVAVAEMPVTQLPPKLVKAFVKQGRVATVQPTPQQPVTSKPDTRPVNQPVSQPNAATRPSLTQKVSIPTATGLAIKQAQQITPKQFQQALQSFIPQSLRPSPSSTGTVENIQQSTTRLSAEAAREALQSPPKALQQLLVRVLQHMPTPDSMQRPQALQSWVSDWFATRPVSAQPSQQMGGLGQMLMTLLGLAMQQQPEMTSSSPAAKTSPNQFTQAFIQQVLNPAPENAGEVRERINALLQQLPQQQLQRLLQLFTGILNSAQSSQARLQDSPPQQPEYYILLPADTQKPQQHELLIRSEHESSNKESNGRTLWLFTLRFELESTGPMLVKGRYHPQGSSVDFYTETKAAQKVVENNVKKLEKRLAELEVNSVKLRVQQGKIPDNLAQQHSGIIRVTV